MPQRSGLDPFAVGWRAWMRADLAVEIGRHLLRRPGHQTSERQWSIPPPAPVMLLACHVVRDARTHLREGEVRLARAGSGAPKALKPVVLCAVHAPMRLHCECGTNAEDFVIKLRSVGWAQPTSTRGWLCPACTEQRGTMATQADPNVGHHPTSGDAGASLRRLL
jgi:hypothetical protein